MDAGSMPRLEPCVNIIEPPSPKSQRAEVKALYTAVNGHFELQAGQKWFIIESRWYRSWLDHTCFHSTDAELHFGSRPGPIDNERLAGISQLSLKHTLIEHVDFEVIHESVWNQLYKWYGGGPVFQRSVVLQSIMHSDSLIVELFPFVVHYCWADADGDADFTESMETAVFSKRSTGNTILQHAKSKRPNIYMNVDDQDDIDDDVRAWIFLPQDGRPFDLDHIDWEIVSIEQLNMELESFQPPEEFYVLLEAKNPDGSWSRKTKTEEIDESWREFKVGNELDACDKQNNWYESVIRDVKEDEKKILVHFNGWDIKWDEWLSMDGDKLAKKGTHTTGPRRFSSHQTSTYPMMSSYYSGFSYGLSHTDGVPVAPGVVGLRNLGNTCFMNSTLQCLSNTEFLTKLFSSGEHKPLINRENPLGWQGKIAEEFGQLVTDLWSNKYTVCVPKSFKSVIGEFQPRFAGYNQQDSSELLSFLLDGLHEDLNQVRNKPPTSPVESNNRPDDIVAAESWNVHMLRNQSVIVDNLQGQLKSKLVCPHCGRVSIIFDPFMFLSVPFPSNNELLQEVTIWRADPTKPPMVYGVQVNCLGTIKDLCDAAMELSGVPANTMIVADVYCRRIYKVFKMNTGVHDIMANDTLYIYECPDLLQCPDIPKQPVPEMEIVQEVVPGAASPVSEGEGNGGWADSWEDIGVGGLVRSVSDYPDHYIIRVINVVKVTKAEYARCMYMDAERREMFGIPLLVAFSRKTPITAGMIRSRIADLIRPHLAEDLEKKMIVEDCPGENAREITPGAEDYELIEKSMVDDDKPTYEILMTDQNGHSCGLCNYMARCSGCALPEDDNTIIPFKDEHMALSLLWKSTKFYREREVVRHESAPFKGEGHGIVAAPAIELNQCIELFNQEEILSESDAWYCAQCKDFVCASKKFDLWRTPNVLIIHLKRFQYSQVYRDKIDTQVNFPINGLDMTPYVCNKADHPCVYDLFAVSNHMGGMGGGHYTAYAKNFTNNKWYEFDDSSTSEIPVKKTAAKGLRRYLC